MHNAMLYTTFPIPSPAALPLPSPSPNALAFAFVLLGQALPCIEIEPHTGLCSALVVESIPIVLALPSVPPSSCYLSYSVCLHASDRGGFAPCLYLLARS